MAVKRARDDSRQSSGLDARQHEVRAAGDERERGAGPWAAWPRQRPNIRRCYIQTRKTQRRTATKSQPPPKKQASLVADPLGLMQPHS